MDVNRVFLTGTAMSDPYITSTSGGTPFASFELEVSEPYRDADGHHKMKRNNFVVELLGRKALNSKDLIKAGKRFVVDGYLRQDIINGLNRVRVRAFAVLNERVNHNLTFYEGMRQALNIMKKSSDITDAIKSVEAIAHGK